MWEHFAALEKVRDCEEFSRTTQDAFHTISKTWMKESFSFSFLCDKKQKIELAIQIQICRSAM